MVKKGSILLMCMIALVAFAIWAPDADAYTNYNNGASGCVQCHGGDVGDPVQLPGFGGLNDGALHDQHLALTSNCTLCHGTVGDDPATDSSGTVANGGCRGCHGVDNGTAANWGTGVRTFHLTSAPADNSGLTCTSVCHSNDPAPLAEDTVPLYYPRTDVTLTDPCNDNLDNDGNGTRDANDDACVANTPPTADANGPYNGTVGVAVQFDGSASADPDGTIVAFDWDFGDGSTGTGVSPTHTYTATGTFTVTLTVTDDGGATDTATTTATIGEGNQPPVADPNGPYTGTVNEPVTFDGSGSNDPDGTIVAFDWDFGDGNTDTGVSPTHTYATVGTFNVTLTVTDDAGATDSLTTTATIGEVPNQPPVADPNGPYTGTAGVPVAFDGTGSNDPDGTIVAFDWDFGDGNTGTGVSPTHTYTATGTFTVTLTVTDDGGATDTATTTATIGQVANQPPVADPNGPYNGTVGVAVQFDGSASADPDGTIVAYDWDFGDGNTGTGVSPTYTYTATGTFTVTLTVTDDGGATSTATTTATIGEGNQAPVADPNGPYTGTVGVPVVFDGTGSNDPDGTIVAYDWDFGDGNTGTGQTPTHTYATADTFNVTLTVTDDGGATDSKMTTATINPARQVIEAEVEAPGAVNGANRGRTPFEIEFDEDGMLVEIADVQCGAAMDDETPRFVDPVRVNREDDDENEFVALFNTRDLELRCEDNKIVCEGTLADGTTFMGMDELNVIRDVDGERCKRNDKGDDDDDDDKKRRDKHDRDDD